MISPFRNGGKLLNEARYNNPTERKRFLRDARAKFLEASGIEFSENPVLPIKAQFYVGVCYDLLADPKNALRCYEEAHESIVNFIRDHDRNSSRRISEREKKVSDLKRKLKGLSSLGGPGAIPYYRLHPPIPGSSDRVDVSAEISNFREEIATLRKKLEEVED